MQIAGWRFFRATLRPRPAGRLLPALILAALVAALPAVSHARPAPETAAQEKTPASGTFGDDRTCDYCKLPFEGRFIVVGENKYHEHCYRDHIAIRCALCGQIIEGRYEYDFWGNSYHSHHDGVAPRCEYCLRFISKKLTGGGVKLGDGREICNICRNSAVTEISQAKNLLKQARKLAAALGMPAGQEPIELELLDRNGMRKVSGSASHGLRGFTHHEEVSYEKDGTRSSRAVVYLLHGMTEVEALSTILHELGHVWQFENARRDNDRALREGSCNYLAWLALSGMKGKEAEFARWNLMESKDKIYGDGFRRVKKYAEENGREAWLDLLREKPRLPGGY